MESAALLSINPNYTNEKLTADQFATKLYHQYLAKTVHPRLMLLYSIDLPSNEGLTLLDQKLRQDSSPSHIVAHNENYIVSREHLGTVKDENCPCHKTSGYHILLKYGLNDGGVTSCSIC